MEIGVIRPGDIVQNKEDSTEGSFKFKVHYISKIGDTPIHRHNIFVTSSPTGNCQIWCISYINAIIGYYSNPKELITEMWKRVLKNILLIDINRNNTTIIEELFKERIISNTPYLSTNGSLMNIVLINTKDFLTFNK